MPLKWSIDGERGVKFQSAPSSLSLLVELLSWIINIKYGCYTFFLLLLQVYKEFLGQVKALTIHHLLDQFVRSKGTGKAIPGKSLKKWLITQYILEIFACTYFWVCFIFFFSLFFLKLLERFVIVKLLKLQSAVKLVETLCPTGPLSLSPAETRRGLCGGERGFSDFLLPSQEGNKAFPPHPL